jgi:hypothetical protein
LASLPSVIVSGVSLAARLSFAHRQGQLVSDFVQGIEDPLGLLSREHLRTFQKVPSFIDNPSSLLSCSRSYTLLNIKLGWLLSNMIICPALILNHCDRRVRSEL